MVAGCCRLDGPNGHLALCCKNRNLSNDLLFVTSRGGRNGGQRVGVLLCCSSLEAVILLLGGRFFVGDALLVHQSSFCMKETWVQQRHVWA